MESLETTQKVVLATLVFNAWNMQVKAARMNAVIQEVLSTAVGQPIGSGLVAMPVEEAALVPLSQLLAERIHRPKYGKNAPLVTHAEVEACCNQDLFALAVSAADVSNEVEDELLDAVGAKTEEMAQKMKLMTLREWHEFYDLVKRLAKKMDVTPEAFLRLEDASLIITRATMKKGEYRKQAISWYITSTQQATQMLPAIIERALDGLAGSDSSNHTMDESHLQTIRQLIENLQPQFEVAFGQLVDEEVQEIYST